jgi:hypothetical protein
MDLPGTHELMQRLVRRSGEERIKSGWQHDRLLP